MDLREILRIFDFLLMECGLEPDSEAAAPLSRSDLPHVSMKVLLEDEASLVKLMTGRDPAQAAELIFGVLPAFKTRQLQLMSEGDVRRAVERARVKK